MKKPPLKLILVVGILLILAGAAAIAAASIKGTLLSQSFSERWAGESETVFSQLSCFMPPDNTLDKNAIYEFRHKLEQKLAEAVPDAENVSGLYRDCWSGKGKIKLTGDRGSGDLSVISVGGNFFQFHPLQLLSGSYITENDVMKDRILLDEDAAWMLFGGTQLEGMTVMYGDTPLMVAGVISRESDFASAKTYTDGPGIFMSHETYAALAENAVILNYEIVLAEPVDNFGKMTFEELFKHDNCEIVVNSGRYSYVNGMKAVKNFGLRSMHSSNVAYPYWENAARYIEDWCALLYFLITLFLIAPFVVVIIYAVKLFKAGRRRIKDKVPAIAEKAVDRLQYRLYSRRVAKGGRHLKRKGK